MGKDDLLLELKKVADTFFKKQDYISAGRIRQAMDVIEYEYEVENKTKPESK